jgi:hypothetical protein
MREERRRKMAGRTVLTADRVGGADVTAGISSEGRARVEGCDMAAMRGIAAVVDRACRHFARDIDWQYEPAARTTSDRWERESGLCCFVVTENDRALRAGGYARVDTLAPANLLRVTAGCYDPYFNPVVVCEKSMALSELDHRNLEELLDEMYDKLTVYYVRPAT